MTRSGELTNNCKPVVGWRRGYAPDCKAPHDPCEINPVPDNRYQDKPATPGERDNAAISACDQKNENPGALAGATGAFDIRKWLSWLDHNLKREAAARRFVHCVMDLDPADRLPLLERAYLVFHPQGGPAPGFGPVMDDAYFRAEMASEAERKAITWAYFHRMTEADQRSFIAKVTGVHHAD